MKRTKRGQKEGVSMSVLSYKEIQQQYTDAMRFGGAEAAARLWVADRVAEAARDAIIVEARRDTPRVRPVILSLGSLLVRIGERLEAAAAVQQSREYA
jgi:hypothetical protein